MTASPNSEVLLSQSPLPNSHQSSLNRVLNRLQPSPETILLGLAVLIGGVTGMGVVTFHYLIYLIHDLTFDNFMGFVSQWGAWTLACAPSLGGILIGFMHGYFRDFGPGITSLIAAAQGLRELTPLRPVTKMIAAAISLGTGASLGPEGPSVETGANFGMLLGQVMQVSQERQRLLLGAGAAAGLAAGFNAPIAGVFFALEVVLGTSFATSAVSMVLLAAVVSALIAQICLGAQPAFALPAYQVRSLWELPLYVGLGVLASVVSLAYKQGIKLAQKGFQWLEKQGIPRSLHPAIGGVCIGLAALSFPQVLGVGYETIESMLQDVKFNVPLLLALLILKLSLTALSLGSGLVGGIFAPAMFLGASLGSAYVKILVGLFPSAATFVAAPPAYAMVGMAAVLAGSAKAPLTSILLLFELTRDYRIVLPLMAAVGLSVWLIERYKQNTGLPAPVDSTPARETLETPNQLAEVLQQIPVSAAMRDSFFKLPDSLSVLEAVLALTQANCHCAMILGSQDELLGIVTLQDINRAIARQVPQPSVTALMTQSLGEICTKEILRTYPDESLAEALDRMATRGLRQMPVVDRNTPDRVIGLLEKESVALAYEVAVTKAALSEYFPLLVTASEDFMTVQPESSPAKSPA